MSPAPPSASALFVSILFLISCGCALCAAESWQPYGDRQQVISVVEFGFLANGQLHFQVGDVAIGKSNDTGVASLPDPSTIATGTVDTAMHRGSDEDGSDNQQLRLRDVQNLLVFLVTRLSWKLFLETVSSFGAGGNEFCSSVPLLTYEFFTTFDALVEDKSRIDELAMPLGSASPGLTLVVTVPNEYRLLVFNCVGGEVVLSINATALNVLPDGRTTYLDRGSIPLPLIYTVFAGIIYPVGVVLYLKNWFAHRDTNLKLHRWFMVPVQVHEAFLVLSVYCITKKSTVGTGDGTHHLLILRGLAMFCTQFATYLFCMAISKGWGVSRSRLSTHEQRAMRGLSTFLSVAVTFYRLKCGPALLGALTFETIAHVYVVWTFGVHREAVGNYVGRLLLDNGEPSLVEAWRRKFNLITALRTTFAWYAVAKTASRLVGHLFLFPNLHYAAVAADETIFGLMFLRMGYLLRLRPSELTLAVPAQAFAVPSGAGTGGRGGGGPGEDGDWGAPWELAEPSFAAEECRRSPSPCLRASLRTEE